MWTNSSEGGGGRRKRSRYVSVTATCFRCTRGSSIAFSMVTVYIDSEKTILDFFSARVQSHRTLIPIVFVCLDVQSLWDKFLRCGEMLSVACQAGWPSTKRHTCIGRVVDSINSWHQNKLCGRSLGGGVEGISLNLIPTMVLAVLYPLTLEPGQEYIFTDGDVLYINGIFKYLITNLLITML